MLRVRGCRLQASKASPIAAKRLGCGARLSSTRSKREQTSPVGLQFAAKTPLPAGALDRM
jgi:hypothetical protein